MPETKGPELSHPVTRDGTPIPFFPISKRLVVERIEAEEQMGGIIIPDTAKVPHGLATVLAAGPKAMAVLDDMGIAIGDTISMAKYAGVDWEWQPPGTSAYADRHKVVLISVDDILGCKELAEKMIDGRMGIALYQPTKPCRYCGGGGNTIAPPGSGQMFGIRDGSVIKCDSCNGSGAIPEGDPEYRFMQEQPTPKAA
jgi:chaperonin GroES